jgi:hypothetical protein
LKEFAGLSATNNVEVGLAYDGFATSPANEVAQVVETVGYNIRLFYCTT